MLPTLSGTRFSPGLWECRGRGMGSTRRRRATAGERCRSINTSGHPSARESRRTSSLDAGRRSGTVEEQRLQKPCPVRRRGARHFPIRRLIDRDDHIEAPRVRPVHSPREMPFGSGRIRLPASACGPNAIPAVSPSCEVERQRAFPLRELLRQSAQVLYEVPR